MGTAALAVSRVSAQWKQWLATPLATVLRLRLANRRPAALRVQQTVSIGNKGMLAIVEAGGEELVVGVTQGCIQFHRIEPSACLRFRVGGVAR